MSGDGSIAIRRMTVGDVAEVVELQCRFLQGSIVTSLGDRFLHAFHRATLSHPATRAFVATDGREHIVGLLSGSLDVEAFNRRVKARVVLPLIAALLLPRGWHLVPAVVRSVLEAPPEPAIPAELLLLVVSPEARRRSVGRRLVAALEHDFAEQRIDRYRVAVRSHLDVARAFYVSTGFLPEQERTVLGAPMTYLTKTVRP